MVEPCLGRKIKYTTWGNNAQVVQVSLTPERLFEREEIKSNNAKKSDKSFLAHCQRTNNNRGHNTLRCTFCGKAQPNFNLEHIKYLLLECGAGILYVSAIKNKFLKSLYSTRQQDSCLSDGWCSVGEELKKFSMYRT